MAIRPFVLPYRVSPKHVQFRYLGKLAPVVLELEVLFALGLQTRPHAVVTGR